MTSVFNLTNGKRIVEESEIKDVLLHVSNEELLTLVEDFIMNYDVTLDELSFLLEWLRRNKVETPQFNKYASSLSLLRFTSIFPELIDIANNSSQKGMRKIESFTNNLITNVSNILKTIK